MFDLQAYVLMGQLLCVAGLAFVIFRVQELWEKPPMLIKCECFNDISHDDMVKVKEMYMAIKKQQEEEQVESEEDAVKIEKKDD